jgi:hypothetical protein
MHAIAAAFGDEVTVVPVLLVAGLLTEKQCEIRRQPASLSGTILPTP